MCRLCLGQCRGVLSIVAVMWCSMWRGGGSSPSSNRVSGVGFGCGSSIGWSGGRSVCWWVFPCFLQFVDIGCFGIAVSVRGLVYVLLYAVVRPDLLLRPYCVVWLVVSVVCISSA